jgi:hypothetical protein
VHLQVHSIGSNAGKKTPSEPAVVPNQGPLFRTFFPGKSLGKIPRNIFPPKMLGKNGIFRGKSFEKSFFQEILQNFPRKVIFRGKKCTKNQPRE